MKNILIIEPTGAICINPNLTAIIRFLCDNSFSVDILTLKRDYPQDWTYLNSTLILCNKGAFESNITNYKRLRKKYDLILGVDQAIISASFIAKKMQVPFGFISYEILFADEVGSDYKSIEIEACRDVSFVISQDKVRGYLVSKEYNIPVGKILCIPVADEFRNVPQNDLLRKHFKIPADKKIALFTGAVTKRSMIGELLDEVKNWNENWVLVLHSNVGFTKSEIRQFQKRYDISKIHFSDLKINNMDGLLEVMASADVGIGFFAPNFKSKYERKNVLFMGLSSGKFAMYLKSGIPVMINEVGKMSDLVREYSLGLVTSKNTDMNPASIDNSIFYDIKKRCKEVYLKYFDFNIYANDLLDVITITLNNEPLTKRYNGIDTEFINSNLCNINQLIYWFNQSYKAVNSKYYTTGENIYSIKSLVMWLYENCKPFVKKILRYNPSNFIMDFNENLIKYYSSGDLLKKKHN